MIKVSYKGYFQVKFFLLTLISLITISVLPGYAQDKAPAGTNTGAPVLSSEITTAPESARLSERAAVFVRKFRFAGNKRFSGAELSGLTAPYENRELTFEEMQAVKDAITLHYVNNGYINSGAIISDQQVADGTITIDIKEGILSQIEIEGNRHFRSDYFRNRLERAAGPILNINSIQQALQILQQDPRISRINAELSPGLLQGEGILKVRVKEESPYKVAISFSNSQSPSVGAYRGELMLSHQSLLGFGDILEGRYGLTEGLNDISLSYSIPVNSRDTMLALSYRNGDSTVIEKAFKGLDIRSTSETYGISLSHPLRKTPSQELSLSLGAEIRRNKTSLLGVPFSFTEIPDNVTRLTALRFSQDWIIRGQKDVLAVRSAFRFGIDAFNATISNDNKADGRFLSWTGQIQWMRQISEKGSQLVFRSDLQLANDALLPMEKFSIGGMNSVRGYRENLLVRDNGALASLELRIPVLDYKQQTGQVQIAPFADIGWSWNTKRDTPEPVCISSVGMGIRWQISKSANLNVYYGYALKNISSQGHDLQDEGLHFMFAWQML